MSTVHAKRNARLSRGGEGKGLPLLLVSAGFALGTLSGCLFVASVSGGGNAALMAYITDFFLAAQSGTLTGPGLFSAGWTVLRWPLLVILLGCTVVRFVGIPVVLFLRGFLLSFTAAAFVVVLGRVGVLFAFLLLGVGSLVTVPVLFILSARSLAYPAQTSQKGRKGILRQFTEPAETLTNILCALALLLATLWEAYLVPVIISGASHYFVL